MRKKDGRAKGWPEILFLKKAFKTVKMQRKYIITGWYRLQVCKLNSIIAATNQI